MLIAAISDTHLARGAHRLHDACLERLRAAAVILHAGDLVTPPILEEIEAIGPPVRAVHGNHGFQIVNTGSPTERRREPRHAMPRHAMGLARASGGRVEFELVALD